MKYTIEGFNQEYATSLKKYITKRNKQVLIQIDCTDLVILRWFVDFYPNIKKVTINGEEYGWVNHNKLLEDLPLINISRAAFIERMQKLVEFDILTYNFLKKDGNKSVYGFGKNYTYLVENTTLIGSNIQALTGSSIQPLSVQPDNNKSIIYNYKEIIDIYHQLCPSFPKCKTLSDKRKKQIKARLDTYSLNEIKEVFTNAENSDFLKGKVNGFKADFDWLMNDNNFAKTLEGKYNQSLTSPKSINKQQTQYNVTKSGTIDLSPKFIN